MDLRVLTWNLMHGRSVPGSGRDLLGAFAAALGSWEWDVALLQEVPPWWPPALGRELEAQARWVLTSRNAGLAVRRAIAVRFPDLIKSHGGGANAILVRPPWSILEHRRLRLRTWPERRVLHAVRLASGPWVANLHASVDPRAAASEAGRAASAVRAWAAGSPAVLGGDFNVRDLSLAGFARVAASEIDYVFAAAGLRAGGSPVVLERDRLSDHAPLAVGVAMPAARPGREPARRSPAARSSPTPRRTAERGHTRSRAGSPARARRPRSAPPE